MTPARQSEMIANPTNVEPKRPSWISRPGTKNLYAPAVPAALVLPLSGTLVSSGPNRARYRIGCTSAMITQAGLRRLSRICRRKTMSVSWMNVMSATPCFRRARRVRAQAGAVR